MFFLGVWCVGFLGGEPILAAWYVKGGGEGGAVGWMNDTVLVVVRLFLSFLI